MLLEFPRGVVVGAHPKGVFVFRGSIKHSFYA
jgi:hypothetical protein